MPLPLPSPRPFRRRRARPLTRPLAGTAGLVTALVTGLSLLAGCSSAPTAATTAASSRVLDVVAAENCWGSIAAQLGGAKVRVRSIIHSPDADPHDYEPNAADGRAIATADLTVANGIGYDPWATKLAAASPSSTRIDLNVGDVIGVAAGGNPHRWYNPADVTRVVNAITAGYVRLHPADAAYFTRQKADFETIALKQYDGLVASIRARYAGTPVGASESIFAMLAPALGLDLVTPPGFLTAVSEGTDPTASDKATIDAQIRNRRIKVYVYNRQNATPDVQAQIAEATAAHIPVTTITETLSPATDSYQQWQSAQLQSLQQALARATGR